MKTGAPTIYTKEYGEYVCMRIATNTDALDVICEKFDDMPCKDTIYQWIWRHQEFADAYAKAKMSQSERMAEELVKIATDKAYYIDAEGNQRIDTGHVASQRLIADTQKWIACKLAPKIYGERVTTETKITISHEDALKALE